MISMFDDEMMRNMLNESQMGLWIIETEEGLEPRMYADRMMLELLGVDENLTPEVCYDVWYDNVIEEYRLMVGTAVEKAIQEGRAEVEYQWDHPKLGEIFVRCCAIHDPSFTKGNRIRGYHQNISDLILLRREKKYLKELNEEILGSLHKLFFSVVRLNLKTDEVKILRNTEDIQENDFASYTYYLKQIANSVIHIDDRERLLEEFSIDHLKKMKKQKNDRHTSEYRRKIKGEYRWVTKTAYFGENPAESDWVIVAAQDVHEQKCIEEQRKFITMNAYETAQKANLAKSDFLSRMSHDMRTPMNAINGMTALALAYIDDKEKLKGYLEKIEASTSLMTRLVNEVLDMSKIENGAYTLEEQPFKLSSLVDNLKDMVMPMMHKKNQVLSVDINNISHNHLLGDTLRIQQVLMNILTNANKYTPLGGSIHMKIEELQSLTNQYGKFCFEISDTGIGMEPDFVDCIFEPFTRAEDSRISKASGTGLGMAIALSIVQLMDGTIQVSSELNKGSCFTVMLNLCLQGEGEDDDTLTKVDQECEISSLHLEEKKILLVEDNEINCEIAKEILEMTGAEVVIAEDGRRAVEVFMNSAKEEYDIIFMDIQMPIMNGNEATIAIRSLDRNDARQIPIIAMTADAFAEDILMSRQSGMNGHLAKPVNINQLAVVLKKWVLD